jgi:hypothetical protein
MRQGSGLDLRDDGDTESPIRSRQQLSGDLALFWRQNSGLGSNTLATRQPAKRHQRPEGSAVFGADVPQHARRDRVAIVFDGAVEETKTHAAPVRSSLIPPTMAVLASAEIDTE